MKRILIAAALVAFNPISAAALQTEVDVQGITRMDERTEWSRHVARVQARLKARTAARLEAQQDATEMIGVPLGDIPKIIYAVFGAYGTKAVNVASCESGLNPSAANGQYFGLFQMGEMERAIYGGSSLDPLEQTQAAYAYFLDSGSDWSPWSGGACA